MDRLAQGALRSAALGIWLIAGACAQDLDSLATLRSFQAARFSSGTIETNHDSIGQIAPGASVTLLDATGPGRVVHIWMTMVREFDTYRTAVLRMYWDGHAVPSVEAPLGKFFGQGFGPVPEIVALPVVVSPGSGMNCYWPMPYRRHARITVTNEGDAPLRGLYYNIDVQQGVPMREDEGYFHASYRQLVPALGREHLTVLEATGEGQYVGAFVALRANTRGWWGEGDEFMWIDGEERPSIVGTGTEDYFGGAWGFWNTSFSAPFIGHQITDAPERSWENVSYRFHLPDPVPFRKSIRIELERGDGGNRSDDHSAVAFWYQREPASAPVSELPPTERQHGMEAYVARLKQAERWGELLAFYETCAEQSACVEFQIECMFEAGAAHVEHGTPAAGLAWFRRVAPGPMPFTEYTRPIRSKLEERGLAADDFPDGPIRLYRRSLPGLEVAVEAEGRAGYPLGRGLPPVEIDVDDAGVAARAALALEYYDGGTPGAIEVAYRKQTPGAERPEFEGHARVSVAGERGWRTVTLELPGFSPVPGEGDLRVLGSSREILLGRLNPVPEVR